MEKTFGYRLIFTTNHIIFIFSTGFMLLALAQSLPGETFFYWLAPAILSSWTLMCQYWRQLSGVVAASLLLLVYALTLCPVLIIPVLVQIGVLSFDRSTLACLRAQRHIKSV